MRAFYISFLILLTTSNNLEAQFSNSIKKTIEICSIIEFIDSLEFNSNRQPFQIFDTTFVLKKNDGVIKIQCKDTIFAFKDNTSDADFFEYSCVGFDPFNKKVLVLGQDYNQEYYYLINQNTNKIDTLVGYPKIFGDRYLCEESAYTDGTAYIEIWNMKNEMPYLIEKFSLIPCNIYEVNESYLKDVYLYLKYNFEKYLKVKISK